jgi:hypothetical protein
MEGNNSKEFIYKINPMISLASIILCVGFAYLCMTTAITNTKTLFAYGIEMKPQVLRYVFAVGFIVFMYICIKSVFLLRESLSIKKIILSSETLTAPENGASHNMITVKYKDIIDVKMHRLGGGHFIYIHHDQGKVVIPSIAMESVDVFQKLFEKLKSCSSSNG